MSKRTRPVMDAVLSPKGSLEVLSQLEVQKLKETGEKGLYTLYRQCALAILNTGSDTDDAKSVVEAYPDFRIDIEQLDRGIRLQLKNAPLEAFVDGTMIASTREMLFCAMRDILYSESLREEFEPRLTNAEHTTDYVFHLLRHARAMYYGREPNMVVCWGGHSIGREEYQYTKDVGYELGLRGTDICTGCGPGAMKGPMKGATIAHAKQRVNDARYLGITEPGIIAAEAPNPIVNELVIMPDIEKRLEAFLRLGHGFIVFPGGPGTAEELLYLLGVLLHPENKDLPFPLILTGPTESQDYFHQIHEFVGETLGVEAQQKYQIIINQPERVAKEMVKGMAEVRQFRVKHKDAFYFNWRLRIDHTFQQTFEPTHEAMSSLRLHRDQPTHELAAALRQVFSGIVSGNVKAKGMGLIEAHGPYQIKGDEQLMARLDDLLTAFTEQNRMKLPGLKYQPCYQIIS